VLALRVGEELVEDDGGGCCRLSFSMNSALDRTAASKTELGIHGGGCCARRCWTSTNIRIGHTPLRMQAQQPVLKPDLGLAEPRQKRRFPAGPGLSAMAMRAPCALLFLDA